MRNGLALHWALPVALLGSCSSELPSNNSSIGLLPDVASQATAVLAGHTDKVWHAEFSPEGSRIVTAAEDGTARLYRVPATPHDSSTGPAAADAPALLRFGHGDMPNGMWNGGVRSILEDSKGNYWFGSDHEGVCRFDGESLTYFTEEDGLSNNQVRTILEDRKGVIWFEMGNGISSYDGERIITHTNMNYTSKDDWRLETGDLWFKGQLGAYRYDGEKFTYLAFPLPADRKSDWHYSVTGFSKGKGGRLWFAMWGAVIGYDGESFTIINDESLGLNEETGSLSVRCVFEDSSGRVWIGSNGIGVFLLDGDTIINFTQANGVGRRDHRSGGRMEPQPGDVSDGAASLHRVFSIGEDRAGNIWFGTAEQGAWRYDGESLKNFTEEDGLTSKDIMAIYTDRRGDLWLGGNGVFKFNGESFDRIH